MLFKRSFSPYFSCAQPNHPLRPVECPFSQLPRWIRGGPYGGPWCAVVHQTPSQARSSAFGASTWRVYRFLSLRSRAVSSFRLATRQRKVSSYIKTVRSQYSRGTVSCVQHFKVMTLQTQVRVSRNLRPPRNVDGVFVTQSRNVRSCRRFLLLSCTAWSFRYIAVKGNTLEMCVSGQSSQKKRNVKSNGPVIIRENRKEATFTLLKSFSPNNQIFFMKIGR